MDIRRIVDQTIARHAPQVERNLRELRAIEDEMRKDPQLWAAYCELRSRKP